MCSTGFRIVKTAFVTFQIPRNTNTLSTFRDKNIMEPGNKLKKNVRVNGKSKNGECYT
jgi:hypothetical protein